MRDRLRIQVIEPNQSLASIMRMPLTEWLEPREAVQDKEFEESKKSEKSDYDISVIENAKKLTE